MNDSYEYALDDYANGVVRMTKTPDNLAITTDERAGTAHRDAAIAHIEKVMKLGYLTGDEAGRRVAYLKDAVTKVQVGKALRDLPAMEKPKKSLDDLTSIPTLFLVIAGALFGSTAVLGGVLMGSVGKHSSALTYLFTVPMLVTGIIGIVATVIILAAKADK